VTDDSPGSTAASAGERGADQGAESGPRARPDDSPGSTAPDRVTASASVATATPERYAKQLASHLGRRCGVQEEADGTRLVFDGGDCLLRPQDEALDLYVSAVDAAQLDRLTGVVGSHLERFGQRNELQVAWTRP
jgi:uncharacterized protein